MVCAGPLGDALNIVFGFQGRVASLVALGLAHPGPAAAGLAVYEATTSLLVLLGMFRRYAALALALLAALRAVVEADESFAMWRAGLVGAGPTFAGQLSIMAGSVLVAWLDFALRRIGRIQNASW
jgi:uncharacterized membrane protein YphA (DoxX/SURF4 family)